MLKKTPPHVIIDAKAGTGKTTTCEQGIRKMRGKKIQFKGSDQQIAIWDQFEKSNCTIKVGAFNSSVKDELKKRVGGFSGVDVSTIHGHGYAAIFRSGFKPEFKPYQKTQMIVERVTGVDIFDLRRTNYRALMAVGQVIDMLRVNVMEPTEECVNWVIDYYGIQCDAGGLNWVRDIAADVFNAHIRERGMIDFTDMIYMPVIYDDIRVKTADVAIIDEYQDLNAAQQELVYKLGRRVIVVGDKYQAIYGFTGADDRSVENMQKQLGRTVNKYVKFPLQHSFRCPTTVIKLAQEIVPDILARKGAHTGEVHLDVDESKFRTKKLDEDDFVICRTNAPLVIHALRLLRERVPVRISGKQFGDDIIHELGRYDSKTTKDMVKKLYETKAETLQALRARRFCSESTVQVVIDKYDTLIALGESCKTPDECIDVVKKLFRDDRDKAVHFSTIHKAKGLEGKRVHFLRADQLPHPKAKTKRQVEQEMNLKYVGITRAMEELTMYAAPSCPFDVDY